MDTFFFIISKLVGALLRADSWLVLALAAVLFAQLRQKHRAALWITVGTFVSVVALFVFPLGDPLLARIEQIYPANPDLDHVDGIVVLGGGGDLDVSRRWGQPELSEGGDRYAAALALARQYPKAVIVFTGGSGALRDALSTVKSESDLARDFFAAHGILEPHLIVEGRSRNTAENAQLSFDLVEPEADTHWVLITSAFHMPRAIRSFETVGWPNLVAYPVDYRTATFADHTGWDFERNLGNLNTVIRELVGQLAYQFASR
jgi:uncharacterized SAM-binding protein YcdF (DUF218 family)